MLLPDLEDGSSIFIDANIFVYHFSKKSRLNPACSSLLERAERKEINGITSISVVHEVTHRMMLIEAAAILPDVKIKGLVKYLKFHPDIVKKLVNHQCVPEKISTFNLEIISSDIKTVERSQQMKRRYGFLSNDALILQIMEDLKIDNLTSNDSDFERVNFITLYKPFISSELSE